VLHENLLRLEKTQMKLGSNQTGIGVKEFKRCPMQYNISRDEGVNKPTACSQDSSTEMEFCPRKLHLYQ
jgi:hypothetical protein